MENMKKKGKSDNDKIWTIWKKSKLNCEETQNICKKGNLKCEMKWTI